MHHLASRKVKSNTGHKLWTQNASLNQKDHDLPNLCCLVEAPNFTVNFTSLLISLLDTKYSLSFVSHLAIVKLSPRKANGEEEDQTHKKA